jgi:hypothetical protein
MADASKKFREYEANNIKLASELVSLTSRLEEINLLYTEKEKKTAQDLHAFKNEVFQLRTEKTGTVLFFV